MALIASWTALAIIVAIGVTLLLHRAQRREDRGGGRPLPEGVDPASLRRTRPLTNRLLGAVLLAAVLVIVLAQRAALFP